MERITGASSGSGRIKAVFGLLGFVATLITILTFFTGVSSLTESLEGLGIGSTSTPSATSVPTPIQLDTPTSVPRAVASCATPKFFQDVWETHPQLGCPVNALISDFTFQNFERGVLVWQKSPNPSTIYALYDNGRWEKQVDPGGPPIPPCPEAEETGGLGPIFSFGTVWCEPWNWKEQLGMPIDREIDAESNQIQNFENGMIFTLGEAGGFIFFSDSHWKSF